MDRLVINDNQQYIYQHTMYGPLTHWSDELYVWKPWLEKVADIRWYRTDSFNVIDKRVAKYHRYFDRICTLERLLEEYASYEYIWNGDDEYREFEGYYIPSHDTAAKAALADLEEYQYLLTTFHITTDDIVSELLADNALLRNQLEWATRG